MYQPVATRLDALTSLRFVAAMMIVVFHTPEAFGHAPSAFNLAQGVSFFYVLSGFILTLVYPQLKGWPAIRAFWRARFARVWPAYILALCIGAWLVTYSWFPPTAVAYVAMVQSWIPLPAFYFGYNAVGWSVATEWFFYLAFPLLVANIERTWMWKLAATFAIVLVLSVLCLVLEPSTTSRVWTPEQQFALNQAGVMYIHPLSRLFEFTCGMAVAVAWRARGEVASRPVAATMLEIAAVAACVVSVRVSPALTEWVKAMAGTAFSAWFHAASSVLAFAWLVYVMALGRGAVSRALTWRPLVLAGEISFSIYLLHQILYQAYEARAHELPQLDPTLAFACYLGVVWLASYVVWRFVEMPARRFIVGAKLHGSSVVTQSADTRLARWRPAFALVALLAAGFTLNATSDGPTRLARAEALPGANPPRRSPRSCAVEFAGQMPFPAPGELDAGSDIVFLRGWFLAETTGVPGVTATLHLATHGDAGGWDGTIRYWTPRPEVLRSMQAVAEGPVGFGQRFDLSDLPAGSYRVTVRFEDGGKTYECDRRQRLVVDG